MSVLPNYQNLTIKELNKLVEDGRTLRGRLDTLIVDAQRFSHSKNPDPRLRQVREDLTSQIIVWNSIAARKELIGR